MNPRIKCCLLSLLLLLILLYAGSIECSGIGTDALLSSYKGGVQENSRKLLGFNAVLDYDYAGPNPKHEPRGKKGGGGSKNP